jgi:hypothetical protein
MQLTLHQLRSIVFTIEDESLNTERSLFSRLPERLKFGTWQIIPAQIAQELITTPEASAFFHVQELVLQQTRVFVLWTVKSWEDSEMKRQEARFTQEADVEKADASRITRARIQHFSRHIYAIVKPLNMGDTYQNIEAYVTEASMESEEALKALCDAWEIPGRVSCYIPLDIFARTFDTRTKQSWDSLLRTYEITDEN